MKWGIHIMERKNRIIHVPVMIVAVLLIIFIAVAYMVQLERALSENKSGTNRGYRIVADEAGDEVSTELAEKIETGESISFYYTDEDGVSHVVSCTPSDEQEQYDTLLAMSIVMFGAVVLLLICGLIMVTSAQNRVDEAQKKANERSTFLANMSHEIRTPLNGVIGLIFLMEKDLDHKADEQTFRVRLAKAKDTAQYLLSLINNILDLSKLQSGKVKPNAEILSLEMILDSIWSMQKNNIESRGVTFDVENNITTPYVIGDELMLKQVLMNIIGNAAKFTPAGGTITLSVSQEQLDEHRVKTTFVCADTGCGMSKEFLVHIWDSFSQEQNSAQKNQTTVKGTGLGMAISKLMVEAMGGTIRVESEEGKGSTFYVMLTTPISEEMPENLAEANAMIRKLPQDGGRTKILVAEDNELNAEILLEILEDTGFDVVYAKDGQEAVEKFRNSKEGEISIILMDMQMPILDGCEATAKIRALEREDASTVAIFACTANNFSEDREKAEACGMNDFLSKPIDVNELMKKLEQEGRTVQ